MKALFRKFGLIVGLTTIISIAGCMEPNAYTAPMNTKSHPQGIVKTYEHNDVKGLQLNRLISELADDLIKNKVPDYNDRQVLAVTSFVSVHSYRDPDELGRVVAEDLIHEMHRRGESVLEYHLTGYAEVTPNGELMLSRKADELSNKVPVSRFLIGSVAKAKGGYVVNARIVSQRTHLVESTGVVFIPDEMLPLKPQPKVVIKNPQQTVVRGGMIIREDPNLALRKEDSRIK